MPLVLLTVLAFMITGAHEEYTRDATGFPAVEPEVSGEVRTADEEDGPAYERAESCDETRNGVRLVLAFDEARQAFVGSVANVTERTLDRVRVEVHLVGGPELGPTEPANLAPGEKRVVELEAGSEEFAHWRTHAEVGRGGEHGPGHEGGHGREHGGEHEGGREGGHEADGSTD